MLNKTIFAKAKSISYLVVVSMMVIGNLSLAPNIALAAHTATVTVDKTFVKTGTDTYALTITNNGADSLNYIKITVPVSFVLNDSLVCPNSWVPSPGVGYVACGTNPDPDIAEKNYIAQGASTQISLSAISSALDGPYDWTVKTQDTTGAYITLAPSVTTTVDNTPPTTINSEIDSAWHQGSVSVILTPTDGTGGVGVASTKYCVGAVDCSPTTEGTSVTVSAEGESYIRYFSTDTLGNVETVKTAGPIKIDNTKPVTTLSMGDPKHGTGPAYIKSTTQISLSPTDVNGSGVGSTYYIIDGGAPRAYLAPFTVSGAGTHSITFGSVDRIGNEEVSQAVSVFVDDTEPIVGALTITPTYVAGATNYISGTSSISAAVNDGDGSGVKGCEYSLDGGSVWVVADYSSGTCSISNINTASASSINIRATDNVENIGNGVTVPVTPDSVKPVTTDSGTDVNWHKANVTVTLTPSDSGSGLVSTKYCIDSTNSCMPSIDYLGGIVVDTEGKNYVRYQSVDRVGNTEDVKTAENTVKIDKTAPTGTIVINSGATHTNDRDVALTILGDDNLSGVIEMKFNNGSGEYSDLESYSATKAWTLAATDGEKTVRVKFRDLAGNITETGIPASIILDTQKPLISTHPAVTQHVASQVDSVVTYTLPTITDAEVGLVATCLPASGSMFGYGDTTVTCSVTDTADNTATPTAFTVTVADNVAPTLTVTGFTADGVDMLGDSADGYTLNTNNNVPTPREDILVQFKSDTLADETLVSEYFGLKLVGTTVSKDGLKTYYDNRLLGVPGAEPFLAYLKDAVDGNKPFAYINGATLKLVDAAKHDILIADPDKDMAIPDNYPLGTYTVEGKIKDLAGNEKTVTFKLIVSGSTVVPTATVAYNTTDPTNKAVVATITPSEALLPGETTYSFNDNGSYTFNFVSVRRTAGSVVATVGNIDKDAPTLDNVGFTENNIPMEGTITGGFTLNTDNKSSTEYFIQFAPGSLSSEDLKDENVELILQPEAGQTSVLQNYYSTNYPAIYEAYLKDAAAGTKPFAYIKTGGTSIQILDGAKKFLASTDVAMTIPGDVPLGTYTVKGTIYDLAGNPADVTFKLITAGDRVAPVAPVITSVAGNGKINNAKQADVVVTGTAEANALVNVTLKGVATISKTEQLINGATTYSITFDTTSLTDGTIDVSVTATDVAGNESASKNATATKDVIIPDSPIITSIAGDFKINNSEKSAVHAIGTAEADSTVSVTLSDGSTVSSPVTAIATGGAYDIIVNAEGLADTTITPTVTVTDAVGNISVATMTLVAMKDVVVPTVLLTSTATSLTKVSPILMTATFSEIVYGFELGDIVITNGSANTLVTSDGGKTHTFNVVPGQGQVTVDIPNNVAQDVALNGNVAATQFSTTYDSIAPTAEVAYSTTALTNQDVTATMTADEAVTVTSVGGLTHTFIDNGTFIFTFTDTAGNPGSVSATVANIDKTAPAVAIASIAVDNYINNSEKAAIHVVGTAEAGATINVSLANGAATVTGDGTATIDGGFDITINGTTLDDGIVMPSVTATDAAGNVSEAITTPTATKDVVTPSVKENSLLPVKDAVGVALDSTISLVFSEKVSIDNVVVHNNMTSSDTTISGSGISFNDTTKTATITLPAGTLLSNTMYVVIVNSISDEAGNILGSYGSDNSWKFTTATGYSISLATGWNLISLPVTPTTWRSIPNTLSTISGKVNRIWTYDAPTAKWLVYNTDLSVPSDANFTSLEAGRGYWVEMNTSGTLTGSGTLYEQLVPSGGTPSTQLPQVQLAEGWNMIGYYQLPGYTSRPIANALSKLSGVWSGAGSDIISFTQSTLQPLTPILTMNPGVGYWLYVDSAKKYSFGN